MRKNMTRCMASALALTMAASIFTGCGTKTEETQAATEAAAEAATEAAAKEEKKETETVADEKAAKDSLVVATANEPPGVSTNLQNAAAGGYINILTHNGLFYMDENLTPQPDLVESYENVSDTEWIFKLKEGVKFHNGTEMKAADVKASLDMTKECPEVAKYGQSTGTIEVVDDYTIKMTTEGPQAGLLTDLCHHGNYILPAELIENGHDFNEEPIGTGPYVFKEWNKGENLKFEAFADYFKGEPAIKNLTWKIIPEGSSRTMALEAGEVDVLLEVESTDVARLVDDPEIEVYDEAGTTIFYLMCNNQSAPFNNEAYRKAVSAAIDKEAIIQVALNGGGSVCNANLPLGFAGVSEEGAPVVDAEAAKAYFEESGLTVEEAGFSIICSDDTKLRAGQVIQASLKEILGVEVTLEFMDQATYLDVTAKGEHQAAIGSFGPNSILHFASAVYHTRSLGSSNRTLTDVAEIDALIEKMETTLDIEEHTAVVEELNALLNDICPIIPLYMKNNTRAYNADLKGFNCIPSGFSHYENCSWK